MYSEVVTQLSICCIPFDVVFRKTTPKQILENLQPRSDDPGTTNPTTHTVTTTYTMASDTAASPSTPPTDQEWISDFVAGWVSGAVSILVCQPVDTILTKWQAVRPTVAAAVVTLHTGGTTTATTTTTMIPTSPQLPRQQYHNTNNNDYRDWRGMTRHFLRTSGGPRALWRGASPVILATPLQNALLMGGYGWGTRHYYSNGNNNHMDSSSSSLSRSKQLGAIFVGGFTGGPCRCAPHNTCVWLV